MLFSDENDYLELLLPKILLKGETVLTRLLEIPEEAFLQDVEIIGWMYQFYISVKKERGVCIEKDNYKRYASRSNAVVYSGLDCQIHGRKLNRTYLD